jgi:subtilase family serine protease
MGLIRRPVRAGAVAVLGLALTATTGAFAAGAVAAPSSRGPQLAALKASVNPTTDHITGAYHSTRMSVEVALAPRNASGMQRALKAIYTKHSGSYHHWLAKGRFDARYAPTRAVQSAVKAYLRSQGLKIDRSASPFLVRATASSARIAAAFHTTLSMYKDKKGISYFANSRAIRLPAALAPHVQGVIGLTNTVREHAMITRPKNVTHPAGSPSGSPSCEAPYPTVAQLFNAVSNGVGFPFGFGDGPGCNGLSPAQTNSIYNAPHVGPSGKGAGVNIAVFELSAYQQSDIDTWAHQFYGSHYTPPLVDVTVDGGPLNPVCPAGDTCPASFNGYAGDIEVDADIEMQLTISPDVNHLIVYNAPNDFTGQTELDEYTAIANQNVASSISSSWAVCENDASAGYVEAENTVFEQMALQGQSMFGAEGDTGAFSCLRSDGTSIVNVLDPPSQPWVTSVGGTSLESANPGGNQNPAYPAGQETVWNVDNLCSNQAPAASNDGVGGFFWCAETGAGGGASSQYWGRPFYQFGHGVNNPNTTFGNGTTQCSLAATGTPCREDPDVSANADEYTPYAEYCTGNANTPNSVCATITTNAPGWFGIGGTSLSSPLWSGIAADRDSFTGFRSGNLNPLLYLLFNIAPNVYFHDITGIGQSTNNNGLYPTTPGYDEATGIGTPNLAALITRSG